jgi:uncharacterized iron-regulated protein
MKNFKLTIILLFITAFLTAQNGQAYKIFNAKGKKVSYKKMIKKLSKADIVLFGEHHDNSINHWLELVVTKDLAKTRGLTLGAEMIEADNQTALNDYLSGKIDKKGLDSLARLWKNYKTDYKPLVDFAKSKHIKFIATNVPRRYASKIFRKGFEALDSISDEEKTWIAPLPIAYDKELPGYVKMKAMMGGHGGENLPKAQAIKDATMGYFIYQNLESGKLFIHYNGSYHSDNYEAISWYLNKYHSLNKAKNKELNIITIGISKQDNIKKLDSEHKNIANFIIAIPSDMTKTL